ncbi:hypothetical protein F5Y17DRAFT_422741 [Xylariaceae sp. FL0594]|nr:hypothetical protein F5Y17DRAFT_422741 [Xylariaceae sp. FL0594]
MAEPPHGYLPGPYYFHPTTTYPSSSGPRNNTSSYYPAPMAAIPPANYTAAQTAYDYNSNRIPGLGLGGAPTAMPASAPPVRHNPAHTPVVNNQPLTKSQAPNLPPKPPSAPHRSSGLEEGELSEGEFEDLYEPRHSTNVTQAGPPGLTHKADSRAGSAGDADGSSIYDPHDSQASKDDHLSGASNKTQRPVNKSPRDDEWEPPYSDRERSGSYSPYLSPREVHRRMSVAKSAARNEKPNNRADASRPLHQLGSATASAPSTTALRVNGTRASSQADNNKMASPSRSQDEPKSNGNIPFRSAQEAKKKAQEAILGLWPLKVRYQDYIEEGFHESIVQALFKELGLDIPVAKTAQPPAVTTNAETSKTAQPTKTPTGPASQLHDKARPTPSTSGQGDEKDTNKEGGTSAPGVKSAAEERKDKIARKLAAMAQKTTVAPSTGSGAPVPKPTPAPAQAPAPASKSKTDAASDKLSTPALAPAPTQTNVPGSTKPNAAPTPQAVNKTKAENTAILQQKLAMLKKQQAQLAAEKAKAATNSSDARAAPSSPAPAELKSHGIDRRTELAFRPTSTGPTGPPSSQSRASAEPRVNPGDPAVSTILQAKPLSEAAQGSIRSLKRPVASDFDNYTPPAPALKRSRTEERLVIDVTDDEDVEMDIGSPTEEAGPQGDGSTAVRSSLGPFPPVSDGLPRRPQSTPGSNSPATPPVKGARIDILHQRIEETKRLIAEAEAKKAARKGTPQQSPAPSLPAVPQPPSLPKLSKSAVEVKKNVLSRRARIASFELPRVNATRKEKQDKLKQIVAEAARLELEVQASIEEEKRLIAEMEQLEAPIEDSPSAEGLSPQASEVATRSPVLGGHIASDTKHSLPQESSSIQKSLQASDSSSADTDEEMDVDSNDDEALQNQILNDTANARGSHDEMSATTTPVEATGTSALSISDIPVEIDDHSRDKVDNSTEQVPGGASTDIFVESSQPGVISSAVTESAVASEPDVESSDSDVSMQQSGPESSESDDGSYEPTPVEISDPLDSGKNTLESAEAVDDIPEEPSPIHAIPEQSQVLEPGEANNEHDQETAPPMEDLLSYKSPLSYFNAYKFHPNYFATVSGGLKSMTYNARIDPMRAVCPVVLAGDACPKGSACEYQHFDSMVLSEAEIITQLGSSEMYKGETKTKFIEGLKRVLSDLRANRIKDFDRITKAIVKYRQEFLGDKSKVLPLDW